MTITLDAIKAEQTKLASLIAQYEAQANTKTSLHFPEQLIELAAGEHYAGIITGKDGEASYHLILIDGEAADINWKDAIQWAKDQGGELPTRREQALLFANLKEQFKGAYYWSGAQYEGGSACAWYQDFASGTQTSARISLSLRARAVRRSIIE